MNTPVLCHKYIWYLVFGISWGQCRTRQQRIGPHHATQDHIRRTERQRRNPPHKRNATGTFGGEKRTHHSPAVVTPLAVSAGGGMFPEDHDRLPCGADRNGRHWLRVELSSTLLNDTTRSSRDTLRLDLGDRRRRHPRGNHLARVRANHDGRGLARGDGGA